MAKARFKSAYDGRVSEVFNTIGESLALQSAKDESDINYILSKYGYNAVVASFDRSRELFVDLPSGVDFQVAMETVAFAESAFESLPASLRARFDHDPAVFLEASRDVERIEEFRELGLYEIANSLAEEHGIDGRQAQLPIDEGSPGGNGPESGESAELEEKDSP